MRLWLHGCNGAIRDVTGVWKSRIATCSSTLLPMLPAHQTGSTKRLRRAQTDTPHEIQRSNKFIIAILSPSPVPCRTIEPHQMHSINKNCHALPKSTTRLIPLLPRTRNNRSGFCGVLINGNRILILLLSSGNNKMKENEMVSVKSPHCCTQMFG